MRKYNTIIFVPHARARFRQLTISNRFLAAAAGGAVCLLVAAPGVRLGLLHLGAPRSPVPPRHGGERRACARRRPPFTSGSTASRSSSPISRPGPGGSPSSRVSPTRSGAAVGGPAAVPLRLVRPRRRERPALLAPLAPGEPVLPPLRARRRPLRPSGPSTAPSTPASASGRIRSRVCRRSTKASTSRRPAANRSSPRPTASSCAAAGPANTARPSPSRTGIATRRSTGTSRRPSSPRARRSIAATASASSARPAGPPAPHLHYEVHVDGHPVNPLEYILETPLTPGVAPLPFRLPLESEINSAPLRC